MPNNQTRCFTGAEQENTAYYYIHQDPLGDGPNDLLAEICLTKTYKSKTQVKAWGTDEDQIKKIITDSLVTIGYSPRRCLDPVCALDLECPHK